MTVFIYLTVPLDRLYGKPNEESYKMNNSRIQLIY